MLHQIGDYFYVDRCQSEHSAKQGQYFKINLNFEGYCSGCCFAKTNKQT